MSADDQITRGRSFPLGATVYPDGVNFSVYSRSATEVELLLFDQPHAAQPAEVFRLDPAHHRTYHYWHVFVPGSKPGQTFAWRVRGPRDPRRGLRFDGEKTLLDPYGMGVVIPPNYARSAACEPGDNCAQALRSVVIDPYAYDWEGDEPLKRPFAQTVIYEMHVRGFTRAESSGLPPEKRGTYAGIVEKIPYLQELGVTAVELLPIFAFDVHDAPPGRVNYWGYSPVSFFAPHPAYSSDPDPLGAIREFRDMVKALHRAGIEVILDVVYNHTAEGGDTGPTLSFRGFEDSVYYMLEPHTGRHADFSGCGNTLNANQPIVRRLILDSLHYWVEHMHVDGFRFDLAAILSRDESGKPVENPPVLWDIESDPVLAGTKLIAEAWDAAGLYQVGSFVGDSWKEWNGRFRDDVRSFLRGDQGAVRHLPPRLLASPDLYGHEEREPEQSVNFVTCHDGFTLNDLVSYNHKHNEANGEHNRDGWNDNRSWNCGVEGPSDDPAIEALRNRQVKNFLTINLIALGVPMLSMGDEVRRSQQGNNNAYCQDSELAWFDWGRVTPHGDILRYTRLLIAHRLRRNIPAAQLSLNQMLQQARIRWHGTQLHQPDWGDASRSLAFTAYSASEHVVFHAMFNSYIAPLEFALPDALEGRPVAWRRWIDTFRPSPEDIVDWSAAPAVADARYRVEAHSIVLLFAPVAPG